MVHRRYCNRCKRTDVPLLKASTNPKKTIQYYVCRECNTKRHQKYWSTDEGKKKILGIARKSRENNLTKVMARELVKYAVRIGYLEKPLVCSACGSNDARIEAHHHDYEKALEVTWLCQSCHANIHR